MRLSKTDLLDVLDRQERTYRLAHLASNWLRGVRPWNPSAAEEARTICMQSGRDWISFSVWPTFSKMTKDESGWSQT
jgi:hypothetical protein